MRNKYQEYILQHQNSECFRRAALFSLNGRGIFPVITKKTFVSDLPPHLILAVSA